MAEPKQGNSEKARTTEDLMQTAPPASMLGDVDDAVTPEVDGELTPWSPRGADAAEPEE